jgi:hypothetical protein
MTCRQPIRTWALARLGWLVLALLLSQTLGLLHGVSPGHAKPLAGLSATAHAPASGWTAHLFDGHNDEVQCRLFDHAGHSDAMPVVAALVLPLVLAAWVLPRLAGLSAARWRTVFDARGPPQVR